MKEEWKDIIGYEGYYQVSNLGRVRSKDRIVTHSNGSKVLYRSKILAAPADHWGYNAVSLCKYDIKRKTCKIHRLVATMYISNPNKYLEVNHKDGNKSNNKVTNLEWVTGKENKAHAIKNKLHAYGTRQSAAKLNDKQAKQIYKLATSGKMTEQTIAKKFKINRSGVNKIKLKISWKHIHE